MFSIINGYQADTGICEDKIIEALFDQQYQKVAVQGHLKYASHI